MRSRTPNLGGCDLKMIQVKRVMQDVEVMESDECGAIGGWKRSGDVVRVKVL